MSAENSGTKDSKPFDAASFTLEYESGDLSEAEVIEGFQHLIDTGLAWQLQGHYGRAANELIERGLCKRKAPAARGTGPYENVSRDETRTFETADGTRTFRILLYGAFNAMGLVGPELNGICVLDEDNLQVVADEIAVEDTGYFGPTPMQVRIFDSMISMDWPAFRDFVNRSKRLRYTI